MSSSNETKWLWRVTSCEAFYEPYTTAYRLVIATSRPLLEADIDLALRHLFRKVPSLRVCLGEKDGERWLKEMNQETIAFEMLPGGKTPEILTCMQQYKFDKDMGPLWCVKVKPGEMEPVGKFNYVYDMFLSLNHIITDGTSNMMICGVLVQLLDAVISGTPVDDTQQLGVYISDEKTQTLIPQHVATLEADPQLYSRLKTEYEAIHNHKSLFKSTYKGLEDEEASTRVIWRDFEADATSSFIQRCRAEGVTVNSAFTAVANVAMVEFLAKGGLLQESYRVRSDHVINARRYWAGDTSQMLGCHILPVLPLIIEIPQNVKGNFWSHAKSINEEMHSKLRSGRSLQNEALKRSITDSFTLETADFVVSNMGDVTQMLTEGGKNVRILHLLRSAEIHSVPLTMSQFIHTYCGRLYYAVIFNTSFVTPATAERYVDTLLRVFDNVIQK